MALSIAQRWEIADRLFTEGCEAVARATVQWNKAHDPAVDADFQRVARARYERIAAYARTRFRRHDTQLDLITREQAVLDANRADRPDEETAP